MLRARELRLNLSQHIVFLGENEVRLRPKAFALLRFLMQRAQQLVTKEELVAALWPQASSSVALRGCMRELRQALGDDADAPRFLETVGSQGYRFLPPVSAEAVVAVPASPQEPGGAPLLGREGDLAQLRACLGRASEGARQLVFVTGEAGIGKSCLVRAFLEGIRGDVLSAVGRCLEEHDVVDAYQPILEALSALCRGRSGADVREILRRFAPTWLLHLPALVRPAEEAALRPETIGATPERMLREMAEALEAIAHLRPLVLVLEDLHWGDAATLDLVSYLGRREPSARLLIVALLRPEDALHLDQGQPARALVRDLRARGLAAELALGGLTAEDARSYLRAGLGAVASEGLCAAAFRRTQGHPLFLANLVAELQQQGLTGGDDVTSGRLAEMERLLPDSLRQTLLRRLRRLPPDAQRLLEAACFAGEEFVAAAAAAAAALEPRQAEELCDRLCRQGQFLGTAGLGEWPDGTVSGRYRFLHALYREVLAEATPPARSAQIHLRIAERLERAFGARASEIAPELALHFERGQAPQRAIEHLQRAARVHAGRYANREAEVALSHALSILPQVRESERAPLLLQVREQRGLVCRAMGDITSSIEEFTRLVAAAAEAGDVTLQVRALLYQAEQMAWNDTERCLAVLEQALGLAEAAGDEEGRLQARGYLGYLRATRRRWSDEDAEACLAAARSAGAAVVPWPNRVGYMLGLRSEHRAVCALSQAGISRALRVGDVALYLNLHYVWSLSLCALGELGEAIDVALRGLDTAERNGHHLWGCLLRVALGHCYERACAFTLARRYSREAAEVAQRTLPIGRALRSLSLTLKGLVLLGTSEPQPALLQLQAVPKGDLNDIGQRAMFDYALGECWLALGDPGRATTTGGQLIAQVEAMGDRSMLALAHRLRARAALAQGRLDVAAEEIGQALSRIAEREVPMTAWRVLATAGEIYGRRGQAELAQRCLQQGAATARRIAEGLGGHPLVRQAFLDHGEVAALLRAGEASAVSPQP